VEISSAHLYLAALWFAYYVLHSILAAIHLKQSIQKKFPAFYPYYRACYSAFFFITLVGILYYQVKMESPLLLAPSWGNYILGIPMGLVGVSIMLICIRKYFYHLSGVKVFYNHTDGEESYLEIDGLHRLMRHPLYAGTLLFAWSNFVLRPELSSLIMCALMNLYLLVGIRIEERKLASEFGAAYLQYKERTPMLIPSFRKSG